MTATLTEPQPLTRVGDIAVHTGQPFNGNPYMSASPDTIVYGDERAAALGAYRDGRETSRYTFWHAPLTGGSRRLNGPHQINWTLLGA